MVFHQLALGQLSTNCYILADEITGNATMIEAPDQGDTILAFLEEKGYTLTDIILTHGHFDHMLALKEVLDKTGAKLSIHENGETFLQDGNYNLCNYLRKAWTPVKPDVLLREGDTVLAGGKEFRVIHTPGHTSDCICLYGEGILIAGDTLFPGSVGRTDHPTGDLQQEVASIQEKLMVLPDETVVYPGHGPSTTIGEERRGNPYLR